MSGWAAAPVSGAQTGDDLVLAVDGGNSKTDLVIADVEGEVLARVRGDGTRPHQVGVAATVAGLRRLARLGMRTAGLDPVTRPAVGAFFLANVDLADDEVEVHHELDRIRLTRRVQVRNDTLAVLRAGSPTGSGVAVVAGAGINAIGVGRDGRQERFLALGALTGDWGGGYSIAEAGLGAAVRAGDGRGPGTVLRELLPPVLGCRTVEELALGLTRGTLPTSGLHLLAPVVLTAAEDGDPVSTQISERLADEVVAMVRALVDRLDLHHVRTPVILGGGVLQRGPTAMIDRIRDRLADLTPSAAVEVLAAPPVLGALYEALALAGAPATALRRAGAAPLPDPVFDPDPGPTP